MLTISYAPSDAELAKRIQQDLQSASAGNILIALISPESNADRDVQLAIEKACDASQHIIPVIVKTASLPKLINHLSALDFTESYNRQALLDRVAELSAPGIKPPLKVRTPKVIASNRGYGYLLAILAIVWFIVGIVLVGFGGIQAPREEYNNIDTQVAATIQLEVRGNLPKTTEEAAGFPLTVQAVPTSQRPLLIGTATAIAASPTPR